MQPCLAAVPPRPADETTSEVGVVDAGQLHEVPLQATLERRIPVHRNGDPED